MSLFNRHAVDTEAKKYGGDALISQLLQFGGETSVAVPNATNLLGNI